MRGIPVIRKVKEGKGRRKGVAEGGALSMVAHTPVIPELSKGRKEDGEFEVSLGYCAHKCVELKMRVTKHEEY